MDAKAASLGPIAGRDAQGPTSRIICFLPSDAHGRAEDTHDARAIGRDNQELC